MKIHGRMLLAKALQEKGVDQVFTLSGGFKEIDDVSIAAPLTNYSVSITDGECISEFVDRAWKIALSGYPGAVHLSLPVDIMFSSCAEVYMGLAAVHQYHPSQAAIEQSDVVIMVGARLDNPMNFGNPPLFPASNLPMEEQ